MLIAIKREIDSSTVIAETFQPTYTNGQITQTENI